MGRMKEIGILEEETLRFHRSYNEQVDEAVKALIRRNLSSFENSLVKDEDLLNQLDRNGWTMERRMSGHDVLNQMFILSNQNHEEIDSVTIRISREKPSHVCGTTHYEGCACHEAAWSKRLEDMRLRAIKAECERDHHKALQTTSVRKIAELQAEIRVILSQGRE